MRMFRRALTRRCYNLSAANRSEPRPACGDEMPERFFGKRIFVQRDEETRRPLSFELDGQEHSIEHVMVSWQDYGFPDDGRKHTWIQRRHRSYYRVRTTEGETFEIYYDRGVSLDHPHHMKWYVTKQL